MIGPRLELVARDPVELDASVPVKLITHKS